TAIHNLSGLIKFICFLLLTFATMYTYDIRVILGMLVFSVIILRISKIKFNQIKLMVIYVLIFILINAIFTFLFAPEQGVTIYGTRTPIVDIWGSYALTQEQLLYQVTLAFKYLSVVPLGIIFLLTTNPSEFASSVSGVGVPYKASFAISLTLRYFPDILRVYNDISQAQQARGLEMSGKAKMKERAKNSLMIIIPLIFSTLERIEVVTNAMDLRGFGKEKRRTWYCKQKLRLTDFYALAVSLAVTLVVAYVAVFINHGRFFNPFI
ncbi:MAG TPA: energy-coupling factor transporter transmembrane component T, partial [Anaerolineales bacterium]|nr:energy-coupling factor transporter transmembrane component T [Anaerolineales bacterium]